jgi:hypothetical protein
MRTARRRDPALVPAQSRHDIYGMGNWFRHASDRIGFDMCGTVEPCLAGLKAAAFGVEAIAASAEPF